MKGSCWAAINDELRCVLDGRTFNSDQFAFFCAYSYNFLFYYVWLVSEDAVIFLCGNWPQNRVCDRWLLAPIHLVAGCSFVPLKWFSVRKKIVDSRCGGHCSGHHKSTNVQYKLFAILINY